MVSLQVYVLSTYISTPDPDSHIITTFSILPSFTNGVATLAAWFHATFSAGGNLTHSKMIRLGQEHLTLMHVAIEPEKRGDLINRLHNNPDLKLLNLRASSLTRRQTQSLKSSNNIAGLKIHVVGPDR